MKAKNLETLIDAPSVGKKNLEPGTAGLNDSSESCCSTAPTNNPAHETILGEGSDHPAGLKPYLIGMAASVGVVGFYLGLLTLTSDWYNARLEFREYGTWIIALAIGLGVQATLFSLYRAWRRGESIKAAKYSLAASGGVSTTAMAACCAHYLAVLLPALGLPFLSAAAASLANYQVYFFMAGVISNLFGIGVMLRMMSKSGMILLRFSMTQSPLYFKSVNDKGGI